MNRRRALMGAKKTALKIKDIPTGVLFKFAKTEASYIYLGVINGTAWMLLERVLNTAVKMRNNTLCDYENSNIDTYLSTTYYGTFGQKYQNAMKDTTVTFPASDGSTVSDKTITRKIFLLTSAQIGNSNVNNVLSTLKKYYNTTSANTARIAKDANGTNRAWWTCTAVSISNMKSVGSSGSFGDTPPNTAGGTLYRRPVVSINKETEVELVDGAYVMV